jgi:hypothetical protein
MLSACFHNPSVQDLPMPDISDPVHTISITLTQNNWVQVFDSFTMRLEASHEL